MIERALCGGEIDVWVGAERSESSDAVLHRVLGGYAGLASAAVRHERDAHGRPVVCGSELQVSVSHTSGAFLVAIGSGCRVGVDVEPIRARGLLRLRHHVLTGGELDELERHDEAHQNRVLLGYWTRKEALLKAAGTGLAVDPSLIELPASGCSPHPIVVPETLGRPSDWWIVELDLSGYAAAVAVDVPSPRIRIVPLD